MSRSFSVVAGLADCNLRADAFGMRTVGGFARGLREVSERVPSEAVRSVASDAAERDEGEFRAGVGMCAFCAGLRLMMPLVRDASRSGARQYALRTAALAARCCRPPPTSLASSRRDRGTEPTTSRGAIGLLRPHGQDE